MKYINFYYHYISINYLEKIFRKHQMNVLQFVERTTIFWRKILYKAMTLHWFNHTFYKMTEHFFLIRIFVAEIQSSFIFNIYRIEK